jgi:hypothetical protein
MGFNLQLAGAIWHGLYFGPSRISFIDIRRRWFYRKRGGKYMACCGKSARSRTTPIALSNVKRRVVFRFGKHESPFENGRNVKRGTIVVAAMAVRLVRRADGTKGTLPINYVIRKREEF